MKTPLLVAALLLVPTDTSAQPYSESMADCASLFQNAAQWMSTDETVDQLMYAANQWHAAAVQRSAAEGQGLSDKAMWDKVDEKTATWEAKGATFLLSEEFRDWTGYCRSFAKRTNVVYTR